MQQLTDQQLTSMVQLQMELNSKVDPNWLTANHPWCRAIRVECAELTDHLGWKWWKTQAPNWAQAQIEVVDIWHFMLSHVLANTQGDVNEAAAQIREGLEFSKMEVVTVIGRSFTLAGLTLHEAVDQLSMFASLNYTVPPLLENIMVGVGLTWEQLYIQYVGKNVLNIFRQDRGYKNGTYEKSWHGEEDNVHLERIMNFRPDIAPKDLRAALWEIYDTVPKAIDEQPVCAALVGSETAV